jgi:hypothetical protein
VTDVGDAVVRRGDGNSLRDHVIRIRVRRGDQKLFLFPVTTCMLHYSSTSALINIIKNVTKYRVTLTP